MTSLKHDLLWLTVLLALLFGAFTGSRPLMTPDEGRYVEIPREMIESGDYLTPHLNYLKYFEKPPLFYWLEASALKVFGLHEWSARLVVALLGIFGCLMTYLAGLKLYDRRTGILACFMLATCVLYFAMAHFVITDIAVSTTITATLLLFIMGAQQQVTQHRRYYFWGMYIAAALAVLSKGLIGVVLPGLVILLWITLMNNWRQLKTYYLPSGILLFLLIAAPWHVLMQLKNPEFFQFYFIEQHFMRYLTDYAGRQQAPWFFSAATFGGFFPWTCFLITGCLGFLFSKNRPKLRLLLSRFWQQRQTHTVTLFFVVWILVIFCFFNFSRSLLLPYALPLMPPLAILLANYVAKLWQEKKTTVMNWGFGLFFLLANAISIVSFIIFHINKAHAPQVFGFISSILLMISAILSALFYYQRGIKTGIITLIISMGAALISINLSYTNIDYRSVKPLALQLKPLLQPTTIVASYHQYYQDLPVYLQQRIAVVDFQGELLFGTQHQDAQDWMFSETEFWKRWHNSARMFMIMKMKDYNQLRQYQPLYPLQQTVRDILVTNKPL